MPVSKNILSTIGNTPIVELNNLRKNLCFKGKIFAKLEYFNPGGSAKDRIAKAMIESAESDGLVTSETVIIEPTSGNTGSGLAMVAAAKGLRIIIVMPDTMSIERRKLIAKKEGILVGISSGAALYAAIELANREENTNKNIVVLLPDTGERYLSTDLFKDE